MSKYPESDPPFAVRDTEGPWEIDPAYPLEVGQPDPLTSEGEWSQKIATAEDEDDVAFIAACATDVMLGLLDAQDQMEREYTKAGEEWATESARLTAELRAAREALSELLDALGKSRTPFPKLNAAAQRARAVLAAGERS